MQKRKKEARKMTEKIKAFFTNNVGLKVVSLVLAILLWFYVQGFQNPEVNYDVSNVPIIITGEDSISDNGFVLGDISKKLKADITVSAKRSTLANLDPSDFTAVVDVSGCNTAESYSLPIKVRSTNGAVTVVRTSPERLSVEIDKMHTVEKEIEIDFVNNDNEEYFIDVENINFNPAKAIVRLPKLKEKEIDKVKISVDMKGVKSTLTNVFKGVLTDKDGELVTDKHITLISENISVTVPVYKRKALDINVKGLPVGMRYKLSQEQIEVAGAESYINSLDKIDGYIKYHDNPAKDEYEVYLELDNLILPEEQKITLSIFEKNNY